MKRAKQFLPLGLMVAGVFIVGAIVNHTIHLYPEANAQEVVPGPPVVEEVGPVASFLDMLKSSEGRVALLAKLAELRAATLAMPPAPGDKRQEILHEVDELERLMLQYQQAAPKTKGG